MDYSNSTGVKIMTPIAADTNCQYQPFSQMVVLGGVQAHLGGPLAEGSKGICYGLAVAWLETMERNGGDFLGQVADFERSPMFYRAYVAYRHQHTFGLISTSGSWTRDDAHGRDWSQKDRFFGSAVITQNSGLVDAGKSKSFGLSEGGMRALCAWLGAAFDTRYFMLAVPGHAMAAVGSRTGTYRFFDPNCGIVSASSARALAACLYAYFSHTTIKTLYRGDARPEWLTATKYKT